MRGIVNKLLFLGVMACVGGGLWEFRDMFPEKYNPAVYVVEAAKDKGDVIGEFQEKVDKINAQAAERDSQLDFLAGASDAAGGRHDAMDSEKLNDLLGSNSDYASDSDEESEGNSIDIKGQVNDVIAKAKSLVGKVFGSQK